MDDLQFNAVLAKNGIARQLKNYQQDGISVEYVVACLNDIEAFIGQANQPTVEDILDSNQNI